MSPTIAVRATVAIESPDMRQAGPELLSLALIDARNHSLQLLACHEQAVRSSADEAWPGQAGEAEAQHPIPDAGALWLAGHIGWFAESWIGRNTQRSLGAACPAQPMRLASLLPLADAWWDPRLQTQDGAATAELPDAPATRAYLLETLESTLELLDKTPAEDTALHCYRLALLHEDLCGEALVVQAQAQAVALPLASPPVPAASAQVVLASAPWSLGYGDEGFAFDIERGRQTLLLPGFEIDAQPVSWQQFVPFIADGGYRRPELWQPGGWAWLQHSGGGQPRLAPRYVEHVDLVQAAVQQQRFGRTQAPPRGTPAMHLSWWEADAWCRWTGRRLPSEAEWERAALHAGGQGFHWGQVHEWTASVLTPWPGFVPAGPWAGYASAFVGRARVLRGGSFASRPRMKHPRYRGFALPGWDAGFVGFRSCRS